MPGQDRLALTGHSPSSGVSSLAVLSGFDLLAKGDHVTCIRQWCKYKYKYKYVCVCVCVCVCMCVRACVCVCVCVYMYMYMSLGAHV